LETKFYPKSYKNEAEARAGYKAIPYWKVLYHNGVAVEKSGNPTWCDKMIAALTKDHPAFNLYYYIHTYNKMESARMVNTLAERDEKLVKHVHDITIPAQEIEENQTSASATDISLATVAGVSIAAVAAGAMLYKQSFKQQDDDVFASLIDQE